MTGWPVWLETTLGLLVLVGLWYLYSTAGRIDRLHRRVEGARAALDNQLLRRATAATDLATSGLLDPASSLLIASAAAEAIAAGEVRAGQLAADPLSSSRMADSDAHLEAAESDLSRALRATLADLPTDDPVATSEPLVVLGAACHRVTLARRFHNDATTQAVRLRRKRMSRWTRLAGTAPLPRTVEMDDEPPGILMRLALPSRT